MQSPFPNFLGRYSYIQVDDVVAFVIPGKCLSSPKYLCPWELRSTQKTTKVKLSHSHTLHMEMNEVTSVLDAESAS